MPSCSHVVPHSIRVALVAAFFLTCTSLQSQEPNHKQEQTHKVERMRILFAGDVMLDGGPGHVIASGRDPFQGCAELFRGVDLSIANLECVLGRGGEQILKTYTFRAASDSPRFLKKYFHAVGLANNHSMDYGKEGMLEMLSILEREQIPFFGAGRNIKEANKPFLFECKGHKVAVLAFNEFNADEYAATKDAAGNAPLREMIVLREIERARENLGCDVVVPFLHWGQELTAEPRADQRELARKWIEAGATAVIGAHPHVTQTIEVHRGSPIVYSLGNFVFDYFPVDPPEWVGWVVILEIGPMGEVDFQIRSVTIDAAGCPKLMTGE